MSASAYERELLELGNQDEEYWRDYPFKYPLADGLNQIKYGLYLLLKNPRLKELDIELDSVDLELVTVRDATLDGHVGFWLVTVAGEVNRKQTQTLKLTLQSPDALPEASILEEQWEDILGLGNAMIEVVTYAAQIQPVQIFGSGEMTFELLASEKIGLEIGARGIIEKVLEIAFGAKADVGYSLQSVRTSTATIKFKNPKLKNAGDS